jgi:hypothetical protein
MAETKRSAKPSTTPRRPRAASVKLQVAGEVAGGVIADEASAMPISDEPVVRAIEVINDAESCPNPVAAAEIEAVSHDPVALAVAHAPHGSSEDSDYAKLPASYPYRTNRVVEGAKLGSR